MSAGYRVEGPKRCAQPFPKQATNARTVGTLSRVAEQMRDWGVVCGVRESSLYTHAKL